ncbi:WLM domain-containing protein [Lenzites betulinus]|nr:WLM domain-containing protein [Lenzites betulinus]
MVHVRLNDSEPNPNPHINFITPLPLQDPAAEEQARQLLRALAAQVRPIMKAEGFTVNSLEEYEYNKVFAGRNWNNGEVVELVLRRQGGAFQSISWLLSVLCHEHMNHGPAFQALWTKLRNDVIALQRKGYYGDGYWSSGTRLADSARVGGSGPDADGLPEYMCGGAQNRARPTSLRRRRRRQGGPGPSPHTGAQTAKRRKAGSRVKAQGTFLGSGRTLNDDVSDAEEKKAGAGFRKKAVSKRAREERALAAERRLLALQGKGTSNTPSQEDRSDTESTEEEYDAPHETDQDRRRTMLEASDEKELDGMKTAKRDFLSDFILPRAASTSARDSGGSSSRARGLTTKDSDVPKPASEDGDTHAPCDVMSLHTGGTTASAGGDIAAPPSSNVKGKHKQRQTTKESDAPEYISLDAWLRSDGAADRSAAGRYPSGTASTGKAVKQLQQPAVLYSALVEDEIRTRTQEALGMGGGGRRLGVAPGANPLPMQRVRLGRGTSDARVAEVDVGAVAVRTDPVSLAGGGSVWACHVCTLENEPQHLSCAACATPRDQDVWSGNSV